MTPGESEGTTVTGVPEDKNPGDLDLERPETFPDADEWKSPPRAQSFIPEDSRPGDSGEFQSGEERETGSPSDQEVVPLTIEQGGQQSDTPLHSVSWRDESHPQWVRIRTVMDSGAADSVAPPTLAPQVEITESPDPDVAIATSRLVPVGYLTWAKRF